MQTFQLTESQFEKVTDPIKLIGLITELQKIRSKMSPNCQDNRIEIQGFKTEEDLEKVRKILRKLLGWRDPNRKNRRNSLRKRKDVGLSTGSLTPKAEASTEEYGLSGGGDMTSNLKKGLPCIYYKRTRRAKPSTLTLTGGCLKLTGDDVPEVDIPLAGLQLEEGKERTAFRPAHTGDVDEDHCIALIDSGGKAWGIQFTDKRQRDEFKNTVEGLSK